MVNLSAEESVRCEGPQRGKFGSLLSLATTQEIWPLWSKGLVQGSGPTRPAAAQRSCLPLLPPCRETLAQPLQHAFPSREHQFHTGHLNLCCPLVAEQVEPPPAGGTRAAFSPLCPSCSCSCPEQAPGQSQGATGHGANITVPTPENLVLVQCCVQLGYQLKSGSVWDQCVVSCQLCCFGVATVQGQYMSAISRPSAYSLCGSSKQHRDSRAWLLVLVLNHELIRSWHVGYLQCCGKRYMEIKPLCRGITCVNPSSYTGISQQQPNTAFLTSPNEIVPAGD